MRAIYLSLFALLFAAMDVVSAQPAEDTSPPGVVLVLSGGGARGAAHVGILEVLEQQRVPVDMIVGTSMGAIVGGLYASGLSPAQMRDELLSIDWRDAFNDAPPRRDVSFRQKENDDLPLARFEFGIGRNGFTAPSGIVAGQKLNFILRRLLLPVAGARDFDDLGVPFRAVSVDLKSGELVVLDRGDLAQAIRASMAFPPIFTAVEWDDLLLIDGAALRNLPVDVALDLGARRIIAVDVAEPWERVDEEFSAVSMVNRSLSVKTEESRRQQQELLRPQDVLIIPAIDPEIGFAAFDRGAEVVAAGADAARAVSQRLAEFAVTEAQYAAWQQRQRAARLEQPGVIDAIEIDSGDRVREKFVRRRVRTETGKRLDLATLRGDLERIYRIGEFEQVGFRIDRDEQRGTILNIDAKEKSWGPWYLRLGLAAESDLEGGGGYFFSGLVRRTFINRLGAEWRTFFSAGDLNSIESEFYQPLEYSGTFFVAPRMEVQRDNDDRVFVNGQALVAEFEQYTGGIDLGARISNWAEIRLGVIRADLNGSTRIGAPMELDVNIAAWRARVAIDRLDNANFPRFGIRGVGELLLSRESIGATDEYDRLELSALQARSFGAQTIVGRVRWGHRLGSNLPGYADFDLGGFLRLSGLEPRSLRGDRLALAQFVTFRRIGQGSQLGTLYVGGALEAGNVWQPDEPLAFQSLRLAGALFAGADTLFGPLYVGYGMAEGGDDAFYLFLGQIF